MSKVLQKKSSATAAKSSVKSLNWGIIGTGKIAQALAEAVKLSTHGKLSAVASRSSETADVFAKKFEIKKSYADYASILNDKDVDIVYISLPHPMHAEWAIKAAEAGKHILCEKPVTMNHPHATAVIEAAHRNQVFFMEAFMYRCHPQISKLVELIRNKSIGEVRLIDATFSFQSKFNAEHRLFNNALGGGGILDVGCYCTSGARLVAGAALGKPYVEPIDVQGVAHLGATGVDEWAIASLKFPNGILAKLSTGVLLNQKNGLTVYGSEGSLSLDDIFLPPHSKPTKIVVRRPKMEPEEIEIPNEKNRYTLQVDSIAQCISRGEKECPAMSWGDTLGNMQTLDRWRKAIGLIYDEETFENCKPPLAGRPLTVKKSKNLTYIKIEGIDFPLSKIMMGSMAVNNMPQANVLFDDYFERGGNCFDTAFIYMQGTCEKLLGQWIKSRGIRKQVAILAKGAHTPHCHPEGIKNQLEKSLERLQTDYADLYMMHRDNLELPVSDFIDVLNELKNQGKIRAFGGSNWSIERIEEANAYAKKKKLQGFSAFSNNFSLARMVEAPWGGCLASSDAKSREWLKKTQFPLIPWSSQAGPFFAVDIDRKTFSDKEVMRCWFSDDNFERLERAKELAKKYKVPTITIALAYVLNQPFNILPIIGPKTVLETRTSFQALDIKLAEKDLKWLNVES